MLLFVLEGQMNPLDLSS